MRQIEFRHFIMAERIHDESGIYGSYFVDYEVDPASGKGLIQWTDLT